ncbi:hypothetical protein H6F88_28235 [Oculatella sp. FACHB-28]|uniref:nSTAND1 domain-containing NTPase n=1 Tax=Oculatella sp. FACHB-28 TaxID=2692845 RepID=UPI001687455A|nr:hypothetical protein [Oculatella sp. FACHB-28]MBD2059831.1 hypothetical protein [Oculatella sp. FACHB-28]
MRYEKSGVLTISYPELTLDRLNRLIRRSNLSSLVVLLDCCHSGYFLERRLTEQTLTAFTGRQDYCLITASRRFEQAWEGEEYSVFTEAVLKGLSLNNQDEDGNVTGDRLFDSIARELRQSGQEPIRMGIGRSLTLVSYRSQIIEAEINKTCPYQGLAAFTAETKQFFFGRKTVVEQLRQKLEQSNFVALIGASGSGKSSVVRAGLIPWLEELGWQILPLIKPGFQPIAELKRSFASRFRRPQEIRQVHELIDAENLSAVVNLLHGSERLLLVVDQFEEVFTVCGEQPEQEKERRRFIQLLTQVESQRLAVVITMRADFMEPCLNYTSLIQQLDHAVYIPPLEGEGLEEAIAKPAQLQGYTIDPGLLALILRDVAKEKNCLPLLQFTLQKLWEPATDNKHRLTIEQYERLGGVIGALDRYAQQICDRLTPQEQDWARRLCLKLVRTGEGTRDTRQRQPKRELLGLAGDDLQAQTTIQSVLTDLVDVRLLVTGEEAGEAWVDLAHEALMEGWQQFAEWRQSDREVRQLCDRIEVEMREWARNRQDSDFLMSSRLLVQIARKWLEIKPYLSSSAHEFYQRSYEHEREKISYETEINVFKEQLQELRVQLTAKLQVLEGRNSNAEDSERSNVSRQSSERARLATEQLSVEQLELVETNVQSISDLKQEVEDFLERAERFEQRMYFAEIAAG